MLAATARATLRIHVDDAVNPLGSLQLLHRDPRDLDLALPHFHHLLSSQIDRGVIEPTRATKNGLLSCKSRSGR